MMISKGIRQLFAIQTITRRFKGLLVLSLLAALLLASPPRASAYDPLAVPDGFKPVVVDLDVNDTRRNRTIPVRVYLPPGAKATGVTESLETASFHASSAPSSGVPAPVLLFSHGLGGTREGSSYLGSHWSARGYVAVFIQHPGSDDSVWRDKPVGSRRPAMQDAASGRNFLLRVKDVPAVLDQLAAWNSTPEHTLWGRLDLSRVGMSGHSFGAVTTQAVSGQALGGGLFGGRDAGGLFNLTDPRIAAAVVMSPSAPRRGNAADAFAKVSIPWMLMTGTHDTAKIGNIDMESRLSVYPALPPGGKYELILYEAEHSVFIERALPGDSKKRNPNHHRVILALTTAFWDAWIKKDPVAGEWLDCSGPSGILEKNDRWQRK